MNEDFAIMKTVIPKVMERRLLFVMNSIRNCRLSAEWLQILNVVQMFEFGKVWDLIIRLCVHSHCKIWQLEAKHKLKNSFQKVLVKFNKLDTSSLEFI